jgi:integrase
MKQSFYLRKPKGNKETLILFSCYFKNEQKQFVYSTRETINPNHWDSENKKPKNKGKQISSSQRQISKTLNKFIDEFYLFQSRCEMSKVKFTSQLLKEHLDQEFGNVIIKKTSFFEVYDKFMDEKIKRKLWKKSTVKRYNNIKSLLFEFEKVKKYKLTFAKVNNTFYTEFLDFCFEYKDHFSNTVHRNVGLFFTFMNWSVENKYTYSMDYKRFKKPTKVLTRQEAFTLDELMTLFNFEVENDSFREGKDMFILQCLTGLRYGEMTNINKRNVYDNYFILKEIKDGKKLEREIPLIPISKAILEKYSYNLPLISNQKQNDRIKDILKEVGFDRDVEFTRAKGVEQKLFVKKFYERISTHTARRTFITIMRNKGIADKTIMSISGHKDIKTFNMYHQVNNDAKIHAVKSVFENF